MSRGVRRAMGTAAADEIRRSADVEMVLGRPVSSCRQIAVTRKARADDDVFFRGVVGKWAYLGKAQLEQAVEHLRAVHREKQEGRLRTNQAGIDTFKRLTWQGTVRSILAA